jgi:hypothetical protein
MAKPPRVAWDSSCFIAWLERGETEDPVVLQALDVTMEEMVRGRIRLVASRVIETEVRPGDLNRTKLFHEQLRACPNFEGFAESPAVRNLARDLQDRLQETGRRGGYADLVHVATAIAARATEFWTTDHSMLRWGTSGLITEVTVCRPYLVQGVLSFEPES